MKQLCIAVMIVLLMGTIAYAKPGNQVAVQQQLSKDARLLVEQLCNARGHIAFHLVTARLDGIPLTYMLRRMRESGIPIEDQHIYEQYAHIIYTAHETLDPVKIRQGLELLCLKQHGYFMTSPPVYKGLLR